MPCWHRSNPIIKASGSPKGELLFCVKHLFVQPKCFPIFWVEEFNGFCRWIHQEIHVKQGTVNSLEGYGA